MASAGERWCIPNNLVFRLGVKVSPLRTIHPYLSHVQKKEAPGYLANTAQGDLIILGDDAVYQVVKMGKVRLRLLRDTPTDSRHRAFCAPRSRSMLLKIRTSPRRVSGVCLLCAID